MSTTQEVGPDLVSLELPLVDQVSQMLGVPPEQLEGWQINRIREDGAIDAYVPIDTAQVEGVPNDPRNVDYLVGLLAEREAEVGGTGQRDPVVIGHVKGEGLYMLDGFHRHEAQNKRGKTQLHATIEIGLTYEQIVKRRLEYARTHTEIEFARQIEWMQTVWDRTPWVEAVPNILTAFRAFQDDYAYDGTDDIDQIDNLSERDYEDIRSWVAERSKEWGYTPKEIRDSLAKVESFDPSLMALVYQKKGPTPAGRISLDHVQTISET